MKKALSVLLAWTMLICMLMPTAAFAQTNTIPKEETPNYKVAFYSSANYHMQDENGVRSGYGYEMMQGISKYMQCTFSYVGYDKTPAECEEMLRNGELDIYTAAKNTPERKKEFAISRHPAITSTTSMNVKVGNNKVVAGDYSTYDGMKIGLLRRHTYNDKFIAWAKKKGFKHTIVYYETPTELANALVDGEVDALVNSYIRTPEDERSIEDFGPTPYYIMARKEDKKLIEEIDNSIDAMNIETPNWRVELFNKYYGSQELNTELTESELALLNKLRADKAVIRAAVNPDNSPYSWYEDGTAQGIAVEIFKTVADNLGLSYEFVPVATIEDYQAALQTDDVDVWVDLDSSYEDQNELKYRATDSYLNTSVSILRLRGNVDKVSKLAVVDYNAAAKEIVSANWPGAEVIDVASSDEGVEKVTSGQVDGLLLRTYTAQQIRSEDVQNRLQVDIVPGASIDLRMGVNSDDNRDFYGIWEKTLAVAASPVSTEIVQSYVEQTTTPSFAAYLFDHPATLIIGIAIFLLVVFLLILAWLSNRSKRKQEKISKELAVALDEAEEATRAKQDFFSKMSHDIRTPLNVVLGMAQVADKYKDDEKRLQGALDSISSEGNYLLVLINSILDVNQLEHGHVELINGPFNPVACVESGAAMLLPLAEKKNQTLKMTCNSDGKIFVGDENRLSQIVINIISNAIKYTDSGGVIDAQLDCFADGRMRFTCTDNGIGMSEEFLKHITEDYVRAEDSRISKVQGTGLGMSVVKGLTELMGGTLTIKSKLGEGSTFIIEIVFPLATEEQCEAYEKSLSNDGADTSKFKGKKVLLAEDNDLNAEVAIMLLESIGLEVEWAKDGIDVVNKFEASKPGEYYVIFMDMQMPLMDGTEASREIRKSVRSDNDIPIIAMTANTFAADRQLCQDAGMDAYIPKPINVEEIVCNLKTLE